MLTRWFYSETYRDDSDHIMPVCAAYGYHWLIPQHPDVEGGWALTQMACGQHQLEAVRQDHRVLVLPSLFDRSTLPEAVTDAYAAMGAQPGMDLGTLLGTLAEKEPRFGLEIRNS